MNEPEISIDASPSATPVSSSPRPQGKYIFTPVVRVKFHNPTKVKFLHEFAGSFEHDVSFAIYGEDGTDTGYVGTILPGQLAASRFFQVDKLDRVKNDVGKEVADLKGMPFPSYVSTMYVPCGVCANTRIVAGLLKLCYPTATAPADFHAIDNAIANGLEINLPSFAEAEAILQKGVDGIPFDDYAEMRRVLAQPSKDISGYGEDWLRQHFAAPESWNP